MRAFWLVLLGVIQSVILVGFNIYYLQTVQHVDPNLMGGMTIAFSIMFLVLDLIVVKSI